MDPRRPDPSRRRALRLLGGAAALPAFGNVARATRATPAATPPILRAAPARASLLGSEHPATAVWTYNGAVPGPTLRVRQGERLRVEVVNDLAEETTVHWHGLRVPNAMDGVPHVTQPPIAPGGRFVYEFACPDAGTFWYHPHARGNVQVDMGLHGALVVEESAVMPVDRDELWVLGDWRLLRDAQVAGDFGSPMDATHAGRIGNTVTINGALPDSFELDAGERIRLRLLNVANARIFALRFEGHALRVIAQDGMPCEPHAPEGGRVVLGPGMRADVVLDANADPGTRYRVIDEFTAREAYEVVALAYTGRYRRRMRASLEALRLRPNPVAEPDISRALRHAIVLSGGMMGGMGPGMMTGGQAWAINGKSATEAGHAHAPLLELALGRSHVFELRNDTAWWHPIHLHGHSFRIVARDGRALERRPLVDTALLAPRSTVEIAFVADNPGDWMFHCHVLEHQASGMMATLRVA
jgi:FtsP/CotA-like multicopper oxidase with cupredoxin domain